MSGKTIKARTKEHDAVKTVFERIIELTKDDKELHDAFIRMVDAFTNLQKAQAERLREKIKQGDL